MINALNKQISFRLKILAFSWMLPKNFTGIIEYSHGAKCWYSNGLLHREDGPAIEYPDGTKEWFSNGKRHRTDGPAFEFSNGHKEWWLNNNHYTKEDWEKKLKN